MPANPNRKALIDYVQQVASARVRACDAKLRQEGYEYVVCVPSHQQIEDINRLERATNLCIDACVRLRENARAKLVPERDIDIIAKALSCRIRLTKKEYSDFEIYASGAYSALFNIMIGLLKDGEHRSEIDGTPFQSEWQELRASLRECDGIDDYLNVSTASTLLVSINRLHAKESVWHGRVASNGGVPPPTLESVDQKADVLSARINKVETDAAKARQRTAEKFSRLTAKVENDSNAGADDAFEFLHRAIAYEHIAAALSKPRTTRIGVRALIENLMRHDSTGMFKLYSIKGARTELRPEGVFSDFKNWQQKKGVWKKWPKESRNKRYDPVRKPTLWVNGAIPHEIGST